MSGLITPERIAEARAATQPCGASWLRLLLRDVLVDRDHHVARADAAEAEVARLREVPSRLAERFMQEAIEANDGAPFDEEDADLDLIDDGAWAYYCAAKMASSQQ